MKILSLLCMLCIVTFHAASAQSLDIGGIELRIGQKIDDALKSLSGYHVSFKDDQWIVSQGLGDQTQLLGSISAKENLITFISKSFWIRCPSDTPAVYTLANKEVRRRGGDTCFTREFGYNGTISAFMTECGPYDLSYIMPYKSKSIEGKTFNGAVYISVSKK